MHRAGLERTRAGRCNDSRQLGACSLQGMDICWAEGREGSCSELARETWMFTTFDTRSTRQAVLG